MDSQSFKIKPIINKKNGQVNFSLGKKNMSGTLKEVFKKNGGKVKSLKIKVEGFELE